MIKSQIPAYDSYIVTNVPTDKVVDVVKQMKNHPEIDKVVEYSETEGTILFKVLSVGFAPALVPIVPTPITFEDLQQLYDITV